MKILWMTWKDRLHPEAGGAEVVNEELAKRLVADGHQVTFLVAGFTDEGTGERVEGLAEPNSTLNPNPYTLVRLGGRYTVYWKVYRYYRQHLVGWADLVIDEVNTMPFFAKFYVKERNILFVHMLCRIVWFYEMVFPLSLLGYVIEPIYLWLLRDRRVVTVSNSTKRDLERFGFAAASIRIISEGIDLEYVTDLSKIQKYPEPTLLSLGSIRPMKRTHHQIKAFEQAKAHIPNLKMKVAGEAVGRYGQKVLRMIKNSKFSKDIEYLGKVDNVKELFGRSHLLLMTSAKEGWGLVATEAASQGTPAVVYDVDGLRDSVTDEKTGIVSDDLAGQIPRALEPAFYEELQAGALAKAKTVTFDQSYRDFKEAVQL